MTRLVLSATIFIVPQWFAIKYIAPTEITFFYTRIQIFSKTFAVYYMPISCWQANVSMLLMTPPNSDLNASFTALASVLCS